MISRLTFRLGLALGVLTGAQFGFLFLDNGEELFESFFERIEDRLERFGIASFGYEALAGGALLFGLKLIELLFYAAQFLGSDVGGIVFGEVAQTLDDRIFCENDGRLFIGLMSLLFGFFGDSLRFEVFYSDFGGRVGAFGFGGFGGLSGLDCGGHFLFRSGGLVMQFHDTEGKKRLKIDTREFAGKADKLVHIINKIAQI